MDGWRTHTEHWLAQERHGLDEAAEAAFAQALAELSDLAPSEGFIARAVDAAWQARARRRRMIAMVGLAASLLIVAVGSAVAVVTFGFAGGWLLKTFASVMTSSAAAIVMAATSAAEWWA